MLSRCRRNVLRDRDGQRLAQERLEKDPQAVRNVARLIRPAGWPPIEIRTVALQGIGGDLLCWQAVGLPATPPGPAVMRLISV
jgi:hypothetical protein